VIGLISDEQAIDFCGVCRRDEYVRFRGTVIGLNVIACLPVLGLFNLIHA